MTMEIDEITLKPKSPNKAIRIKLLGTDKGETEQGLMVWLEINMTAEAWKETLIFSAWDDKAVVGPHYEIATCSNKGAGGVTRPLSFWWNEENPTKHVKVFELQSDGVEVKACKFQNGWAFRETADHKCVELVKPDGTVAQTWR